MEIFEEDQVLLVESPPNQVVTEVVEIQPVIVEDDKTIVINTPETDTVYIGAVGPQGPLSVAGELQFNTLIPAGETRAVSSINTSLVDSVYWDLTIVDRTNDRKRISTVRASSAEGDAVFTIGPIYGTSINRIPHSIDVQLIDSDLIIYVTNTHTEPLTCEIIRLKTNRVQF